MRGELTKGPVMRRMLLFAVPMILGNLLQQCYNVADTLIVGRVLGANALAAVGSAFTLMTVISLGARVALAYLLSAVPAVGVAGIWWSVPIGWLLADLTGLGYCLLRRDKLFRFTEFAKPRAQAKKED